MSPTLIRAFHHPLVILSILLLLLNDHLLKAMAPSWLTGKLSDFAGLFFFPFLVGVVVQAIVGLRRGGRANTPEASRRFLLTGILFTGVLFAVIKTIPAANLCIENALSVLLGGNVRIVRDPTDLLALVMMAPAWGLWQRIQNARPYQAPGKLAYAALGLGALASLATSPSQPIPSVQRLAVEDNVLYASAMLNGYQAMEGAYLSLDGGETWRWEKGIPQEIEQELHAPVKMPVVLCEPNASQICYRIDGRPLVEESRDGGLTWVVAWELPLDRVEYMNRVASGAGYIAYSHGKIPDLHTFDMVIISGESGSKVLALMGNEGFLVHTAGSGWRRLEMDIYQDNHKTLYGPAPTPWKASTFEEADRITSNEKLLGIALSYLSYLVTSILVWVYTAFNVSPEAKMRLGWVFSPVRAVLILVLILLGGWLIYQFVQGIPFFSIQFQLLHLLDALAYFWLIGIALLPLAILVISIVIWTRAATLSPKRGAYTRLGFVAFILSLVLFAASWVPFLLWAFDKITRFADARLLATSAVGVVLLAEILWIFRGVRRILKIAPPDREVSPE